MKNENKIKKKVSESYPHTEEYFRVSITAADADVLAQIHLCPAVNGNYSWSGVRLLIAPAFASISLSRYRFLVLTSTTSAEELKQPSRTEQNQDSRYFWAIEVPREILAIYHILHYSLCLTVLLCFKQHIQEMPQTNRQEKKPFLPSENLILSLHKE